MNLEYFKKKQTNIEQQINTIQLHRIGLFIGIGLTLYSIFMIIVFTLNDVNLFTSKGIPLLTHPFILIFLSICSFLIYIIEEKYGDKL